MPTTTALLVIDIQRGAFDAVRCPPISHADRLIGNASALVAAARAGGHTVAFVQHCDEPSAPFEEGTVHWQLHQDLVPASGDVLLKKYASSAFEATDLHTQLEARGVKNLVMCGLQSEFCVSNTARSALQLGYGVTIAGDGHSTWPSDDKTAEEISAIANAQLLACGAKIHTTQALAHTFQGN